MRSFLRITLGLWLFAGSSLFSAAQPPDGIEFFEKKIRPVLVEHCYKCHSAEATRLRGKLRLDTKEGLRNGGRNGPAIIPGKAKESLLVQALHYQDLEMPPNGKLPARIIADFEKWVAMGAPDPRTGNAVAAKSNTIDFQAARKHWAFQPIGAPKLPPVKNQRWPISPVDFFVLAKLEAEGLTPSPEADRRTLIRRAYFDLIGLPPTYEEVQAFVNDADPRAFAKVVDRLLASPHYGERWGRHWLDVARYADTKDLVLQFGKDRIRPYAYTYRDYVVKSFNLDVPFDQFIHEQLAADMIRPKVEAWKLAAMGFLTLGRLFDNNLPDIYDDQIDTVTRGLLGLTVSCARCHDHKYDAIPTADYYSLYGVFASSERPVDLPLIAAPEETTGYRQFAKTWNQKKKELQRHIDEQYEHLTELFRNQTTDYLVHIAAEPPDELETAVFFLSLSPNDLRPQVIGAWRRYLAKRSRSDDPVFGPWHELMQLPEKSYSRAAAKVIKKWQATPEGTTKRKINPFVKQALSDATIPNKAVAAIIYGELLKKVYRESKRAAKEHDAEEQAARGQLLEVLTGPESPTFFRKSKVFQYMSRVPRTTYRSLLHKLDRLAVDSAHAPPRAMILVDSPTLYQPKIFIRGNPNRPGKPVPRRFLQLLSEGPPEPFTNGSGRLELAHAITAADNPLTSRVMVNRVWMHHIGRPLVSTPNDFGVRSSPPTHPELLDFLSWTFMKKGWSLKELHRMILLSRTWQQSSFDRPDCRRIDPENRWLWRYQRRQMDLEAMRDSMLFVSGRLDPTIGGRPVNVVGDPTNSRRTVYGLVDRQDVPNLYRAFNFASPDQSAGQRPKTIVPQQALFAMNSPFVVEQAKSLARRVQKSELEDDRQKLTQFYRYTLQRDPTEKEIEAGRKFIQTVEAEKTGDQNAQLTAWEQYAQVLLMTNEFMFVD